MHPPFSLLSIGAMLHKDGWDIKIVDEVINPDYKKTIINDLKDALCLGVTSMTGPQIKSGLDASALAKEVNPDIKVIWGGYHPSILPEQTVENKLIDIVVKGQGERTFFELVTSLAAGKDISSIEGVVYKKNGKIFSNPPRKFEDINNFPDLPFELINIKDYIFNGVTPKTIGFLTSRGCPFDCKFCAELKVTQRRWSGLTPERVLKNFEYFLKNGVTGIHIYDSNFFVDKKRVKAICGEILDRKLDLTWGNVNLKANSVPTGDELWELLYKTNCKWVLVGAESGSQEILDFISKRIKVEDILELKKNCHKYDILPFMSFIIGFPYGDCSESYLDREFKNTLDLIDKIIKVDNNNCIFYQIYTPFPGNPLYDISLKTGKFREPKNLEEWSKFVSNFVNVDWLPKKYEKLLGQLNKYIFPYISKNFDEGYKKSLKNKRFKILFAAAHEVLKALARMRWKTRFFAFPLEYNFIKARAAAKYKKQ